ncbi:hypothetical protein DUNSADRAFT_14987 [Dunaliella salina]|uniref:BTB domain-containing protein n=1 Tax=Dunaliella salina TaxID=3046 RepID=A0ABQ7H280_DUNSA|nr:hypothetical protein DUNSADRAFT_14987 [Dunaliella salina]|eukprot:KAF5840963.1 hypothetical protein DUNSADRAFT_14987 [Dunaliella salina]
MSLLTQAPSIPHNGHAWLFSNTDMSDVLLEFQVDPEEDEDGNLQSPKSVLIPAHAVILASCSEYFRVRLLRWAGPKDDCSTPTITGDYEPATQPESPSSSTSTSTFSTKAIEVNTSQKRLVERVHSSELLAAQAVLHMMYTSDLEQSSRQRFSSGTGWGAQPIAPADNTAAQCAESGKSEAQLEASYRVMLLIQMALISDRWRADSCLSECLKGLQALDFSKLTAQEVDCILCSVPCNLGASVAQVQLQHFSQKAHHKIGTVAKPARAGNVRNASPAVQALEDSCGRRLVQLFGDVHTVISDVQLRDSFCESLSLPAIKLWAASDQLTVDSENSVTVLLTFWVYGPNGSTCTPQDFSQLPGLIRIKHLSTSFRLGVLPHMPWFQAGRGALDHYNVVGALIAGRKDARLESELNSGLPPVWCGPPRKLLPMSMLQKRSTMEWAVPEAQLMELINNAHKTAQEMGISSARPILEGSLACSAVKMHSSGGPESLGNSRRNLADEHVSIFSHMHYRSGVWWLLELAMDLESMQLGVYLHHGSPLEAVTHVVVEVSGSVACNRAGGKISRQIQRGIIRKGVGYGWNNFFGCTQPVQSIADLQRFVMPPGNLMLQVILTHVE